MAKHDNNTPSTNHARNGCSIWTVTQQHGAKSTTSEKTSTMFNIHISFLNQESLFVQSMEGIINIEHQWQSKRTRHFYQITQETAAQFGQYNFNKTVPIQPSPKGHQHISLQNRESQYV